MAWMTESCWAHAAVPEAARHRADAELSRRRRARRRQIRRRRARLRRVLLLLVVAAVCYGAGWLLGAVLWPAVAPYGFDQRFRPDHIQTYSNLRLGLQLNHPACVVPVDVTTGADGHRGTLLRLGFVEPGDSRNVLVLLVRPSGIPAGWSRDRVADLVADIEIQAAAGLRREYAAHDDVLSVRSRATEKLSVGGVPSLRWTADLGMKSGRVVRVELTECFAGRLRFTFVSWTALEYVAARREFARVVESLDYRVTWGPAPNDGKVWVAVPSRPRDIFALEVL